MHHQALEMRYALRSAGASKIERSSDSVFVLKCLEDVEIPPMQRCMVPTGISIALPAGFAGFAIPDKAQSSIIGYTFVNSPGLIDTGYRGELSLIVQNLNQDSSICMHSGDPISRLLVLKAQGALRMLENDMNGEVAKRDMDCANQMYDAPALGIKMLEDGMEKPEYAHSDDNGLDIRSAIDATIDPWQRLEIPFGFGIEVPKGHVALVLPRSGLAARSGLSIVDSPSIVGNGGADEELSAVFVNMDPHNPVRIARGDRIAQLVILKSDTVELTEVDSPDDLGDTSRGSKGFGSSGV